MVFFYSTQQTFVIAILIAIFPTNNFCSFYSINLFILVALFFLIVKIIFVYLRQIVVFHTFILVFTFMQGSHFIKQISSCLIRKFIGFCYHIDLHVNGSYMIMKIMEESLLFSFRMIFFTFLHLDANFHLHQNQN